MFWELIFFFLILKLTKKKTVIKKSGNCLLNRGCETNCKWIIQGKKMEVGMWDNRIRGLKEKTKTWI